MLIWLNGVDNNKWNPNENYAREMQELFSLGADRGAYTEDDVREMARTLTGWRCDWVDGVGNTNFRFDPDYHDDDDKTVYGQTGNFDYTDAVRLCVSHPLHPSFFVTKLWSYFVPTPPDAQTQATLESLYTGSGYGIGPVVEAILQHPDFYEGPELVTPPAVYNAGLMRANGRYVDTTDWAWLSAGAGQQLFYPPTSPAGTSPAGWTRAPARRAGTSPTTSPPRATSIRGRTAGRPTTRPRRRRGADERDGLLGQPDPVR